MAKRKNGIMIRGKGMGSPYSRRLLTESLISSGFVSGMAQEIARKVQKLGIRPRLGYESSFPNA